MTVKPFTNQHFDTPGKRTTALTTPTKNEGSPKNNMFSRYEVLAEAIEGWNLFQSKTS